MINIGAHLVLGVHFCSLNGFTVEVLCFPVDVSVLRTMFARSG